MPTFHCYDFKDFKCCSSCHSEWEEGHDEPTPFEYDGDTIEGCCNFYAWFMTEIKKMVPCDQCRTNWVLQPGYGCSVCGTVGYVKEDKDG